MKEIKFIKCSFLIFCVIIFSINGCNKLKFKMSDSIVYMPNNSKIKYSEFVKLDTIIAKTLYNITNDGFNYFDTHENDSLINFYKNVKFFLFKENNFLNINIDSVYIIENTNNGAQNTEKWWHYNINNKFILFYNLNVVSANWSSDFTIIGSKIVTDFQTTLYKGDFLSKDISLLSENCFDASFLLLEEEIKRLSVQHNPCE